MNFKAKLYLYTSKINVIIFLNHIIVAYELFLNFSAICSLYILLGYLIITKIGGEIANHRYFSHKSFSVKKHMEHCLFTLGCLTGMGSPIGWALVHRLHHQYSDTKKDPHSPLHKPLWYIWLGLYNWDYFPPTKVMDISKNRIYRFVDKYYSELYATLLITLFLLNLKFAILVLSFGCVITFHFTALINIFAHTNGYKNFPMISGFNNLFLNIFSMGEALHNNHHAKPESYRFNYQKKEIDFNAWLIEKLFICPKKE